MPHRVYIKDIESSRNVSVITSSVKKKHFIQAHGQKYIYISISLEYINTWTFSFSLILNVSTKIGHACVIKLIYIPPFYHIRCHKKRCILWPFILMSEFVFMSKYHYVTCSQGHVRAATLFIYLNCYYLFGCLFVLCNGLFFAVFFNIY